MKLLIEKWNFIEKEEFIYFMIVFGNSVLDIVSKHEPDECYKKGEK